MELFGYTTQTSTNTDIDFNRLDNDPTYTMEDELLEIVNSDNEDGNNDDTEDSFFSKIEPCYVEMDRQLKRDGLI